MNVLGTEYSHSEFKKLVTSKTKLFNVNDAIISQYYYMSTKISGLNPLIPILDIVGYEYMEISQKNIGRVIDTTEKKFGKLREFNTWVEGVKAHIDIITIYMGLGDSEFEKTMYSEAKNTSIGTYKDFVNRVLIGAQVFGLEVSESDLYASSYISQLSEKGIIVDKSYWQKALLTSDGKVKASSVVSLMKKVLKKL